MHHIAKTICVALSMQDFPSAVNLCDKYKPSEKYLETYGQQEGHSECLKKALQLFKTMRLAISECVVENITQSQAGLLEVKQKEEKDHIVVKDDTYVPPFYFTAGNNRKSASKSSLHKKRPSSHNLAAADEDEDGDLGREPPKKRISSEEDHHKEIEHQIAATQDSLPKWVQSVANLRKNTSIFLTGPETELSVNIAKELICLPEETSTINKLREAIEKYNRNSSQKRLIVDLCDELESMLYIYRHHIPIIVRFVYTLTQELSKSNRTIQEMKEANLNK